jgi:hypothetical protein
LYILLRGEFRGGKWDGYESSRRTVKRSYVNLIS